MKFAEMKMANLKMEGNWRGTGKSTAMPATTTQNNGGKKKGETKGDGTQEKKVSWKKVAPKPVKPQIREFKGKTYHWCPHHKMWMLHHPTECLLGQPKAGPAVSTPPPTEASPTEPAPVTSTQPSQSPMLKLPMALQAVLAEHSNITAPATLTACPSTSEKEEVEAMLIGVDKHASTCMTGNRDDFVGDVTPIDDSVSGIAGGLHVTGIGTVRWTVEDDDGSQHSFLIPDSHWVPNLPHCLFSPQHWARVYEGAYVVSNNKHNKLFWDGYTLTIPIDHVRKVPLFQLVAMPSVLPAEEQSNEDQMTVWHRHLGHVSGNKL